MTRQEAQQDLESVLTAAFGDRLSDDDIKEIAAYSFDVFEALGMINPTSVTDLFIGKASGVK